jgi:ATP-dependent 26S proteasome regulatory subunit
MELMANIIKDFKLVKYKDTSRNTRMNDSLIKTMLDAWEQQSARVQEQVTTEVVLNLEDMVKMRALAETYRLPVNDLLANLIYTALREVEEQIPYVAGSRVIRTEEGDPVYEDIGRMPSYLAAKARFKKSD